MQARSHVANHEQHGIDLAPMLDFVINLLIFFIITAVFVKETGIVVNRSTGQAIDDGPETTLIRIAANGDIFVGDRVVDPQAVRANVERMKSVEPERGVQIVADATAPTGVLIEVADEIRRAGIYDVSFSTQE